MQKRYDVITIGETMIRLSPPHRQRLEQAESLTITVGGAEFNVAVCLSRLGLRAAWVSRLVANPWGRRIANTLRAQGVDIDHIIWTSTGRVGTYFVEFGQAPRSTNVIYDRQGSAMSEMSVSDLDPAILDDTRLVHLTGITPALGEGCRRLVEQVWAWAGERGTLRSFDINYRAKLWSKADARRVLEPLCADLDILFISQHDASRLFECQGQAEETLEWMLARFRVGVTVLTMGEEGAMALDRDGCFHRAQSRQVPEVDALGSGDALSAGFLYGYLTDGDLGAALQLGAAAAALKRTIHGDLALVTLEEVRRIVEQGGSQTEVNR